MFMLRSPTTEHIPSETVRYTPFPEEEYEGEGYQDVFGSLDAPKRHGQFLYAQ